MYFTKDKCFFEIAKFQSGKLVYFVFKQRNEKQFINKRRRLNLRIFNFS